MIPSKKSVEKRLQIDESSDGRKSSKNRRKRKMPGAKDLAQD
jgi:hypothetical protein